MPAQLQDLLDAIDAEDPQAIREVLAAGVPADPVDEDGEHLLFAMLDLDHELTRPLLEAGISADVLDSYGATALMGAACNDSAAMVRLLLDHGADVRRRTSDGKDDTVLTYVLGDGHEPSVAVFDALLDAGADPNAARADGWTPLMLAVDTGAAEIVTALLAAGADVDGGGADKAIDVATRKRRGELVALLTAHGARDPIERCVERMDVLWAALPDPGDLSGAEPAAVDAFEAELGRPLTTDIRVFLLRYGGARFDGYRGLSLAGMHEAWHTQEAKREAGAFDDAPAPGQLDETQRQVRHTWWHPGWIPFAVDRHGDLLCFDLDPAELGAYGQVINWDPDHGPYGPAAWSLEHYLGQLVEGPDAPPAAV